MAIVSVRLPMALWKRIEPLCDDLVMESRATFVRQAIRERAERLEREFDIRPHRAGKERTG